MQENNKIKIAVFPVAGMGTRFLPATKVSIAEYQKLLQPPQALF